MPAASRFADKIAIVTGGGDGIGAGITQRLLSEGAKVAVLDLNTAPLRSLLPASLMGNVLAVEGDCTDLSVLEGFHEQVLSALGPVDVLVNNVGQSGRSRSAQFHESSEDVWRFVLEVSLFSTMRMSRLVAQAMRERGGRIVNMSSDAAFVGDAGLVDYASAKMGLIGFTRSLARELAPFGVTVNAVAPGAIRTRAHDTMPKDVLDRIKANTPAGIVGEPEDVGAAVAFLASAEARFITGQTLLIDGGRWMI